MTLYEMIFARRSVRQYDNDPLSPEIQLALEEHLNEAQQLFGQNATFEITDKSKIKGGTAPFAILAFSEKTEQALINIGYILEGVDLWLQSIGVGSIWCGTASPVEAQENYRILLGFGNTSVPLRKGEQDFKRKKISEISNEDNAIAHAARLAPSAVNFQPWKLTFGDGQVEIKANVGLVAKMIPGKIWLFDLGIITKYIEIALEHEGKIVTEITTSGGDKNIAVTLHYQSE